MANSEKKSSQVILVIISAIILFSFVTFSGNSSNKSEESKKGKITELKYLNFTKPLKFSASLNNRYYYKNKELYLNLEVLADEIKSSNPRTPLNISVVIDKSGSMASKNKLDFVKKAVEYIVDELQYDDYISIIVYDDNVSVLYYSSQVEDKISLKNEIRKIKSSGYTNLSGGMSEGFRQVEKTFKRGYVNRVLLLSDGLANRGITDRLELINIVKGKSDDGGIIISTFGVGNDFNENLMADIANYGKGNYYYINNSSDIPEIFANELKGVRLLASQNTEIKVKFNSEYLSVNKIFGYIYNVNDDELSINLKDIFSGQKKNILIKFDIKKRIDRWIEFENYLIYENVLDNHNRVEEKIIKEVAPAKDIVEYEQGENVTVKQNVVRYEANDIMEQALLDADNGNYEEARLKIKKGKEYIDENAGSVPPSAEMQQQYENLDKYGRELEGAETKSEEEKKEMQKTGKYQNYESRK